MKLESATKTQFNVEDRIKHRMRRSFISTQPHHATIGVSLQTILGDNNAKIETQAVSPLASIGEIIRAKLAKVVEGETRSRAI